MSLRRNSERGSEILFFLRKSKRLSQCLSDSVALRTPGILRFMPLSQGAKGKGGRHDLFSLSLSVSLSLSLSLSALVLESGQGRFRNGARCRYSSLSQLTNLFEKLTSPWPTWAGEQSNPAPRCIKNHSNGSHKPLASSLLSAAASPAPPSHSPAVTKATMAVRLAFLHAAKRSLDERDLLGGLFLGVVKGNQGETIPFGCPHSVKPI